MKQYLHTTNQRYIDVLKLGINNIDNQCDIVNAFEFTTFDITNALDMTTFVDIKKAGFNQIVLDWDDVLVDDVVKNKLNFVVILDDKDDQIMIRFIDKINEWKIDESKQNYSILSNEFTSYEVAYSLNWIVNNEEYRS